MRHQSFYQPGGIVFEEERRRLPIQTYRVIYRYEGDDTEYAVAVDERSEENAKAVIMAVEPIIIVRVERVGV